MAQKAKKTKSSASKKTTRKTTVKAGKPATATTPRKSAATKKNTAKTVQANPFLLNGLTQGVTDNSMETVMTQGKTQFDQMAHEATSLGRDSVEAFIKSGTIFAKGFEDIMRTTMTLAQTSAERQTQLMKEAMGSKSINEWTDIQNKIAQANFDDFMANATKISEMSVKVLTETSEPFNQQMGKVIKKAAA